MTKNQHFCDFSISSGGISSIFFTDPPKESSLELTVWVPFVRVLSFTLFIVQNFSTPKTCHGYCGGGGGEGRIF